MSARYERATHLLVNAGRIDPVLRSALADVEAEVERLRGAVLPAILACYELLLRDYRETNPEKGVIVESGAEPAWSLVCEARAALEKA